MKIKILVSVLLLALALPAAAEFRTVQRAYEVDLAEMRLPQNEAGTISFKSGPEVPLTRKAATLNSPATWY